MLQRSIPASGELLPVIGLGTWQTFDTTEEADQPALKQVLQYMHDAGGRLIDSSPMYGEAEKVVGDITKTMPQQNDLFYATKVWTTGLNAGIRQMESSFVKMQRSVMDLVQVHNLTDWKTHLQTLRTWKGEGKTRYIGITHYTDSSHEELESIITNEPIDFVQFNYSIVARNAEHRLLDAAKALGVATIINRPFGGGQLFKHVAGKPLPAWAGDYGITNWAAYFLKYIVSHPAVTCIIPATANPAHAAQNFAAVNGELPGGLARRKMADHLKSL